MCVFEKRRKLYSFHFESVGHCTYMALLHYSRSAKALCRFNKKIWSMWKVSILHIAHRTLENGKASVQIRVVDLILTYFSFPFHVCTASCLRLGISIKVYIFIFVLFLPSSSTMHKHRSTIR